MYLAENIRPARQVGIEAYRPDGPVTIVQLVRCLCCLYAIVLMLSIFPVFAQSFQVHSYTEDDGLPSSTVYDVAQDSSGLMWFAPRAGVASYDGISWSVYFASDGLPGPNVLRIEVDHQGTIWALDEVAAATDTSRIYISYLKGQRWQTVPHISIPRPLNPDSDLIMKLISKGNDPVLAVGVRLNGIYLWTDGHWVFLSPEDGITLPVNAIVPWKDQFDVATGSGLAVINGTKVDHE